VDRSCILLDDERTAGRKAVAIIGAFSIARFLVAAIVPLTPGEAYTLTIARRLDVSYFDHPPLHQWLAHFAMIAFGEDVLVRLPFILLFAGTSWFVYLLTRTLFERRAALIALFAINSSVFFFVGAGYSIIPDGPLIFATGAAMLLLGRLFFCEHDNRGVWRIWLGIGLCLGLAGLAKYTAVLFAGGVISFMALSPRQRRWFAHPGPYVAAIVCLTMIIPVIVWNEQHSWISFLFQLHRVSLNEGGSTSHGAIFLAELLELTPWISVALIVSAKSALVRRPLDERHLFLLCLSLPTICVFNILPLLGAEFMAHWPMPGWFCLFPLVGAYLDSAWHRRSYLRRWAITSTATLSTFAVVVVSDLLTGWVRHSLASPGNSYSEIFDPTLDASAAKTLREAALLSGSEKTRPDFVVTYNWKEGGIISIALGPGMPVVSYQNPRGIAYLEDSPRFAGEDAVIVVSEKRAAKALEALRPLFGELGPPQRLPLGREGIDEMIFVLIPARCLLRQLPFAFARSAHVGHENEGDGRDGTSDPTRRPCPRQVFDHAKPSVEGTQQH
jgi:Dolichyl-phosphate-mannose-protein mannosyltransferase